MFPDLPVLITGGVGFVGTNLAHALAKRGRQVVVFDDLSRPGVSDNRRFLEESCGQNVRVVVGDVRDNAALHRVVQNASIVFHLAAQVAVTTSVRDPARDFEVNARGTLNLLEALRRLPLPPPLIFTSTNKVYGGLGDVALGCGGAGYEPVDGSLRERGIGENQPLDFHSPYGCSKGAADQYVLDYARTFGLKAVVFRMSCIYGPHQRGSEDQGWVAHFLLRTLGNKPITLFGDGRQVRDLLFVEDLVDAFVRAETCINALSGQAFNIGGGPHNAVSLLEVIARIKALCGSTPVVQFENWRPGDQRYYVSDASRFTSATGWKSTTSVNAGLNALHRWLAARPRL